MLYKIGHISNRVCNSVVATASLPTRIMQIDKLLEISTTSIILTDETSSIDEKKFGTIRRLLRFSILHQDDFVPSTCVVSNPTFNRWLEWCNSELLLLSCFTCVSIEVVSTMLMLDTQLKTLRCSRAIFGKLHLPPPSCDLGLYSDLLCIIVHLRVLFVWCITLHLRARCNRVFRVLSMGYCIENQSFPVRSVRLQFQQ